jgi:hypothetical protein
MSGRIRKGSDYQPVVQNDRTGFWGLAQVRQA